jgi:hypothetical protein
VENTSRSSIKVELVAKFLHGLESIDDKKKKVKVRWR